MFFGREKNLPNGENWWDSNPDCFDRWTRKRYHWTSTDVFTHLLNQDIGFLRGSVERRFLTDYAVSILVGIINQYRHWMRTFWSLPLAEKVWALLFFSVFQKEQYRMMICQGHPTLPTLFLRILQESILGLIKISCKFNSGTRNCQHHVWTSLYSCTAGTIIEIKITFQLLVWAFHYDQIRSTCTSHWGRRSENRDQGRTWMCR